ncbi:MAG: hypothetical protein JW814_01355 [Candidatus Krumholzibacteriota bacterium]|nr:hypothetical protein [Candidatus Krumholzibacteriota bacterium]
MKRLILFSTIIVFLFISHLTVKADPVIAEGRTAVADTAKTKKERVRKTASKKKRDASNKTTYASDSDEKTSFFGSCLGSILESVCSSIFSDDKGKGSGLVGDGDHLLDDSAGKVQYRGNIEPGDPSINSVKLWDKPGGYKADGFIQGDLEKGVEVDVIESDYFENTLWVLVTTRTLIPAEGWVMESDVARPPGQEINFQNQANNNDGIESIVTPNALLASAMSSDYVMGLSKFGMAELSYPLFANESISEEYIKNTYRIGGEFGLFISETMHIDFTFGYLSAKGKPLYIYGDSEFEDSPQDSELQILSYGLNFGQLLFFNNNMVFIGYGIGPALFDVRESARIKEYENDILTGGRTDELAKYKLGGEIKATAGFVIARSFPVGLTARYSLIPWKSDMEKSLTLDYLDSSSISTFSFGISVGLYLF